MLDSILDDEICNNLSLEGKSLLQDATDDDGVAIYVLLTDTKSLFQKVAKKVTKQPYNHVSLAFDDEFKDLYSYSLWTPENGFQGGMVKEDKSDLIGSLYSLYIIKVDHEIHKRMKRTVDSLLKTKDTTSYNAKGLVNALLGREIFKDEDKTKMICSQFVANVFEDSEISLLKDKKGSLIKPYDFVKSKLLKFVRRGVIK